MRAVVQRVSECSVTVGTRTTGKISGGLLVYLGVEKGDTEADVLYLVNKISKLRIFNDSSGRMNVSISDYGGSFLVVSQFTLCADTRKGNRPSYNNAADPKQAEQYYIRFVEALKTRGFNVQTGQFQAHMHVTYTNTGPVTILVDSRKTF